MNITRILLSQCGTSPPRMHCTVPVTDHPLMIENSWEEWPLTKTEIADGFYQPVCVTMRIVIDHLAVGVLVSFATVGIMHSILWHRLISGEIEFCE